MGTLIFFGFVAFTLIFFVFMAEKMKAAESNERFELTLIVGFMGVALGAAAIVLGELFVW